MQQSMYSALFGALTNEFRLNNIANNLANVNTNGYKRDVLAYQDTFVQLPFDMVMEPLMSLKSEKLFPEPMNMARTRIATSKTDYSQGSLKYTGNPLDLAIAGEGFFKVNTPDGDFFTRNGHFTVSNTGNIVTPQGFTVLGAGGAEINIPAATKDVQVVGDGTVYADGVAIGQLQVSTIDDLTALEKKGHNLYKLRDGATATEQEATGFTVEQGSLEAANVEVVYEMVNMIEAQRQFEAYQKVMQTTDSLDKEATTRVGKARV